MINGQGLKTGKPTGQNGAAGADITRDTGEANDMCNRICVQPYT